VIKLRKLTKSYGEKKALNSIDLDINEGEILGLVGESGSGKSTLAKLLIGLETPTSGTIENPYRSQIVFQDPYSSMNPRMNIMSIIAEPLHIKRIPNAKQRVLELIQQVGLSPDHLTRYPHSFSGGQRQRICIARALALKPQFLICDEPTSALDIHCQSQIIKLLKDLQAEMNLTILFITHDLPLIRAIADRIAVLHQGNLVELAESETLYNDPKNSYTKRLLDAIPASWCSKSRRDKAPL